MDFCKVQLKHPYGIIGVSWEKAGETTTVTVTIPPNTTATICTEDKKKEWVIGSGTYTYTIESHRTQGENND